MTVSTEALTAALSDWGERVFIEAAGDLADRIRDAAPVGETGNLQDSVQPVIGSTGIVNTGAVEVTAEHASFVDEGTQPHPIEGNPLLAFEIGGETVIVHSAQHPGTTAQPFFTDNATEQVWLEVLEEAAEQFPLLS